MVHKMSPIDHGALTTMSRDRVRPRRAASSNLGLISALQAGQQTITPSNGSSADQWSPRRSFAFLVAVNGATWLVIAAVLKAVI